MAAQTHQYDASGRVIQKGGTAEYPVACEFNSLGEKVKMRTRRGLGAQPDSDFAQWDPTTWTYDPGSGALTAKTDAAGKAVTYAYYPSGLLFQRIWARPRPDDETENIVTTYQYDAAGRLISTAYSDGTPSVTTTYDRAGRAVSVTDASGTRTNAYIGPGGALSSVTYGNEPSPLAGLSVAYGFNAQGQKSSVSVLSDGNVLSATSYGYQDGTGRLASIAHEETTASYDWSSQVSGLPGKVTYTGAGITGTRLADEYGRLDEIAWRPDGATGSVAISNNYTLDNFGRRMWVDREDGRQIWYGYNDRGEVMGFQRSTAITTGYSRTTEYSIGYWYDEIGNRIGAGESLYVPEYEFQNVLYTANALNQYSAIANPDPGKRKIKGQISAAATLTVTSTRSGDTPVAIPATRNGTAFSTTAEAAVSDGPAWRKVVIEGRKESGGANNGPIVVKKESGFYFPPKDEALAYDEDGNLIQDGRWNWEWDGENRLKAMETNPFAAAVGVPLQRLELAYDSQSRRVRKVLKEWDAIQETFVLKKDTRFLYDGWNVIAEFESTTGFQPVSGASVPLVLRQTYAWGLDLSGTETGAGGVGGLLFVKLHSTTLNHSSTTVQQLSASTLAPCYDGNGNILAYVDCATGQTLARYEYDPFGKLLLKDEDSRLAGRLHHQFSTKYTDNETGLSYYGFRYYSPELGRWVSRDPIGEAAGLSLYAFVANDGVSQFDYLGKYTQAELDNMSGTPGFDPGSFNSGYGSPGNFGSPASACGYTSAQLSEILGSMLGGRDAVAYQYGTYDAAIQSLLAQIRANQGMCCQNGQRVPVEPVWKVQGYDSAEECESCNSSWYGRLAAGVADWAIESGAAAGIAYLTGASGGTAIAIGGAVGGVFNAAEIQPFTNSYNDSVDRACLSGVCPQGSTGL